MHRAVCATSTVDGYEVVVDHDPTGAGCVAYIDTPSYHASGHSDGSTMLLINGQQIELAPDELALLERVLAEGVLRRLAQIAAVQRAA